MTRARAIALTVAHEAAGLLAFALIAAGATGFAYAAAALIYAIGG